MAGVETQAMHSPCPGMSGPAVERSAFGRALRLAIAGLCHGIRGRRRFS